MAMEGWRSGRELEKEASANGMVEKLKLAGSDASGLFMLNNELVQRVFTRPIMIFYLKLVKDLTKDIPHASIGYITGIRLL